MTIPPSSAGTESLLPCPVCQIAGAQIFHDSSGLCVASCENDDCRFTVQIYGASAEDAAKNWNTRSSDVAATPARPDSIYSQFHLDNWTDADFASHPATTRKTLAWLLKLEAIRGVAQGQTQPGKWALHRQPADQIADHEYSIWLGEEPVIMANAMPGCSKYLNLLVDTLNAHPTPGGDKGEVVAWVSHDYHLWLTPHGLSAAAAMMWKEKSKTEAYQTPLYAAPQPTSIAYASWQPIETAPKERWIIGYTSWGQHVGAFHEHVGPCEWITDHFEFTNTDFDVFRMPTHWQPWPAAMGLMVPSTNSGGAA